MEWMGGWIDGWKGRGWLADEFISGMNKWMKGSLGILENKEMGGKTFAGITLTPFYHHSSSPGGLSAHDDKVHDIYSHNF